MRVVNSFCYPERLTLDPMKNTTDPDPGVVIPDAILFRLLIPDPIYLVTTLLIGQKPEFYLRNRNHLPRVSIEL